MDPRKGKVPSKGSGERSSSPSPASRVVTLMTAMSRNVATGTSIRLHEQSSAQQSSSGVAGSANVNNEVRIQIRSLDGKTTAFPVKGNWTVKNLKEKFAEYRGDGWDNVVMLYRGKRLKDEELLSAYDIEPDSFIQANFRSKGGSGYFLYVLASAQEQLKLTIGVGCGLFISIC
ncbi:unnamed protein product [Orchesella dallaii]|uniref:Ubiquitin-like domain-containing protein n=1 Tax=Orchesella dallaii TaxID=48710 RepID=A0ABP1QL27_9HEXA